MISGGGNLKDALKMARELGCQVTKPRNAGGEWVVSHPGAERKVRLNGRRKDTPRSLTAMLRRIEELRETKDREKGA